jgi:hypothetical protein
MSRLTHQGYERSLEMNEAVFHNPQPEAVPIELTFLKIAVPLSST